MHASNNSDVCSLIWLKGFGESIPLCNDPETDYSEGSPSEFPSFKFFLKEVRRQADKDSVGSYDAHLFDHSLVMAACVMPTKGVTHGQPKAIQYFRRLGFHEIPVESYGKYHHGLMYFHLSGFELKAALEKAEKEEAA